MTDLDQSAAPQVPSGHELMEQGFRAEIAELPNAVPLVGKVAS